MRKSSKVFVGMDVHKESIDITLEDGAGRQGAGIMTLFFDQGQGA